jgi:hypothetical protein
VNIPAAERLHLSEEGAVVRIPLEQNRNDKGSLFAGSIFAGAILAGYRAAERCFAERGLRGELVAKTASISYLKRIVSDGRAEAVFCNEPICKPNGNHALTVTVSVADVERVRGAEVNAEFVLLKEKK